MHRPSGRLLPCNQDLADKGLEDEDKDATVANKNAGFFKVAFFSGIRHFLVAQFVNVT